MNLFYVENISSQDLKVKQSKFISYLVPYEDFKKQFQILKDENSKAKHFVYAYRYFNDFNQIVENQSDDGEPKGSAGRPTLIVLQGQHLINCAIITVRYFGGTKLGIGGLARAYSESANLAIKKATLHEYKKMISSSFTIEYRQLKDVEYIMQDFNIRKTKKNYLNNGIQISFTIQEDQLHDFLNIIDQYII